MAHGGAFGVGSATWLERPTARVSPRARRPEAVLSGSELVHGAPLLLVPARAASGLRAGEPTPRVQAIFDYVPAFETPNKASCAKVEGDSCV